MKKRIFIIIVSLLVLVGVFASCKEKEQYPIEILITEYSLVGTSCQWKNLNHNNKLVIINSNDVLRNYTTCTDGNYPEFDFSKWTLLVFSPSCCNIDSHVKQMLLQQLSKNKYLLTVGMIPSETANAAGKSISALIPKTSDDSQIELDVTIIQN